MTGLPSYIRDRSFTDSHKSRLKRSFSIQDGLDPEPRERSRSLAVGGFLPFLGQKEGSAECVRAKSASMG